MKKIAALIITLAALVNLTACGKTPAEDGQQTSDSISSAEGGQQSSDSAVSAENDPQVSDDVRALIDAFAEEEFTAPDGSVLKRSDAVKAHGTEENTFAVGYDFSFIRYAQPVWGSSVDDPDYIDWDTLEKTGDPLEYPTNVQYFKVQAGDTLDNGLTVKNAEYYYGYGVDGTTFYNTVEFDGELTLEGILCYVEGEPEYVIQHGDVFFFADPTKCGTIPVPLTDLPHLEGWTETDSKLSVDYDGQRILAGNIDDLTDSIADLLKEQNGVRVTATLRNIRMVQTMAGPAMYAEIVSAEKV